MHMSTILVARLAELKQLRPEGYELQILETGTIRQDTEAHRLGDGWSTVAFAKHVAEHGGHVTSIDLEVDTARPVLDREHCSTMTCGRATPSTGWRPCWRRQRFDVILLDSDNDAQLILHEFMIAQKLLNRPGLIMVDDVVPGSRDVVKGHELVPWLGNGQYSITERTAACGLGVLATVCYERGRTVLRR
jgi:hypothetical protein